MLHLEITEKEGTNLLDCVEDVTNDNTGPMNINQQETKEITLYHQETEIGPVIANHCRGQSSPEQLGNPQSIVKKKSYCSV